MGVRHLLFLMNFGNVPCDRVHRSMRLMMEEVAPRVQAAVGTMTAGAA